MVSKAKSFVLAFAAICLLANVVRSEPVVILNWSPTAFPGNNIIYICYRL
jgi:hypothetical protein